MLSLSPSPDQFYMYIIFLMTQSFNLPNDQILLSSILSDLPTTQINQSRPSFSLPRHSNYTVIFSDSTSFYAVFSLWSFLTSKPSSRVVPAYPQLFCNSAWGMPPLISIRSDFTPWNVVICDRPYKYDANQPDDLCIDLIKNVLQPTHKLHGLLPDKHSNIKMRETRANSIKIYKFHL